MTDSRSIQIFFFVFFFGLEVERAHFLSPSFLVLSLDKPEPVKIGFEPELNTYDILNIRA